MPDPKEKEEPKAKDSGDKGEKGKGDDEKKRAAEKPRSRPVLIFEGSLEDAKFMVSIPGATVPKDTKATISAGPASNPKRGMFKLGAEGMGLKFEADGVARGEGDLSQGAPDATHAVAFVPGFGDSDAVPLPRRIAPDDLEVEGAIFPDPGTSDFLVTLTSREHGRPAKRTFTTAPRTPCAVLDDAKHPINPTETNGDGKLSLYIRLDPRFEQATVDFVLPNGQKATAIVGNL